MEDNDENIIKTPLGFVIAGIDGDTRYTTRVDVWLVEDHRVHGVRTILISRTESAPTGGMDSFTRSEWRETWARALSAKDTLPAIVLKTVRSAFDDTIVRYGKPTKRFRWYTHKGPVNGFSAATVKAALAWANELHDTGSGG